MEMDKLANASSKSSFRSQSVNTVAVIGLGYIGLPTATLLATKGVEVVGIDIDPGRVEDINRGTLATIDEELDELLNMVVGDGSFRAAMAAEASDVFVVAVPTPLGQGNRPDVSHVEASMLSLAPLLRKGDLVVIESTCPVGTTETLSRLLADQRPDLAFPHEDSETHDIFMAYCPERVLLGNLFEELVGNDRIIGGITPECSARATSFFKLFVNGECWTTNARSAEMCKLVENASRDVNIAFANEVSVLCDQLSIDVWSLIELVNRHPRVKMLQPGPGVGGHCIAIDPWFIVDAAPERARLIKTARAVNDAKPSFVCSQVRQRLGDQIDASVGCLGLAFKRDVDDLRQSPAIEIVSQLALEGFRLLVAEPHVDDLPEPLRDLPNVSLVPAHALINEADLVVVLVDHTEFRNMPPPTGKAILDTRGMWRDTRQI